MYSGQVVAEHIESISFGRIKVSLAAVKESLCGWKAILSLEGTWWNFLVCLVVQDVALLKIKAFPGAVLVDFLCGCCCLLGDLMVGVSAAAVVACGLHVVFIVCCCWRGDVLVFVLIFEFSSGDWGDFRVFRLVVVLVIWWGFGCGGFYCVSVRAAESGRRKVRKAAQFSRNGEILPSCRIE